MDEELTLLGVIADIRKKTELGDKPMLSELADAIVKLIEDAREEGYEAGHWSGRNGY